MEKRFLAFCLAAMLTLYSFAWLNNWLNPPPPPQPEGEKIANAEPNGNDPVLVANENESAESTDENQAATDAATPSDGEPVAEDESTEVWTPPENQQGTIGSLVKDSPFRLLVAWNNRGASLERVELNDEYSDLEDKTGYLGHLGLYDAAVGGCIVNVVGAGTPASLAKSKDAQNTGLKPNDRILAVNGESVQSKIEFSARLENTKPKEVMTLTVDRGGKNIDFEVVLTKRPLEVIRRPELNSQQEIPLSYLLTVSKLGNRSVSLGAKEFDRLPSLRDENWDVEVKDESTVEFSFRLTPDKLKKIGVNGDLQIIKRYTIAKRAESSDGNDAYHINMEVEMKNLSNEMMEAGFRLDGPTGLPIEGWWYAYKIHPTSFGGAGIRDIVARNADSAHRMFTNPKIVKHYKKNPDSPDTPLFPDQLSVNIDYLAVDSQYFLSGIIPGPYDALVGSNEPPKVGFHNAVATVVDGVDSQRQSKTDVTFQIDSNSIVLPPNGSSKQQFTIFAGPKHPDILAKYGLDECISYGWFRPVATRLTWVMHFFYGICGNFGVSIILLTVLVRGCLLPIGRQQALNAQRMQELAPEMKRIAEKYKDDMEKRAQAQRELFRKNNYNPLAGCLPMFLQLPIFIGLYRSLSVDIELRQAPLIPGFDWCSNLAGPDQLWRWDSFLPAFLGSETGFLGPYLNILPLISVGLMLVQQKLFTPPAQDEQQAMQLKMMKYMMIFFGFMFFRVPAGLCLYFITSSLWGIGERKLIPKPKLKKKTTADADDNKSGLAQVLAGGKKQQSENGTTARKQRKQRKQIKPKKK